MGEIAEDGFRGNAATRCVAHRKNGDRCKRQAIKGATVCRAHGGAAGHVKRKARQRLEEASDRMARQLLGIAESAESETVRLAAIKDALDRAGLKAPTTVDVSVGPKPYETVLGSVVGLSGGSRAESRAARGQTDDTPRMLPPASRTDVPLDVEVVEPSPERGGDAVEPSAGENGPAASGAELMPMEDALELLAQQQAGSHRR